MEGMRGGQARRRIEPENLIRQNRLDHGLRVSLTICLDVALVPGQPKVLERRIQFSVGQQVRVEDAVPLLRETLTSNPNHAPLHWELGYAYRFAGMLNESVAECLRAREIDPMVKSNGSALNGYLYLGEYDKFLDSLPDTNDSAFIVFYRGFGEYYQKKLDLAARDFDRAYQLDPTLYTRIGKAFSDSIAHQNSDGLELLHQLENRIQQRGVGDPEATYKIAQAYAALGDKPSALRMLRYSIDHGFFAYPYFIDDPLLDSIRNEGQFPGADEHGSSQIRSLQEAVLLTCLNRNRFRQQSWQGAQWRDEVGGTLSLVLERKVITQVGDICRMVTRGNILPGITFEQCS
jgi:hypothetical protein